MALNLASAERLPVADELYSNGPHLATGNIEVGSADLTPETSRHLDIGIRRADGDITWSITGFVTSYDRFIFLRDTGFIDPVEELPVFAYDQQDATMRGLEAELFMPIAEAGAGEIDVRLFADYVEGDLDDGEYLPRLPPRRFGARLQYHDDRFVAGVELTRYDDQDKIATYEDPTPGYTMLNADLSWQLQAGDKRRLEIFFRGTNLLDEEARKHTSFVKNIAPLPGRNLAAGIRLSL